MVEQETLTPNDLETNRQQAISGLDIYLQTPRESVLREYQLDVMQSLRDFLAQGETAGYIALPTGSGKTHLIAKISQALGLKTVLLSPTKIILEQTFGVTKRLAPDADITNYYSSEKKADGQLLNTTYQSFALLLEKGLINSGDVELLICDEADLGLGEQRHKIYRQLPNSLLIGLTATPYYSSLEGYRRRGIVKEDERWVQLFTNRIHEMSLEEGMEKGILTGLDVHLLETNAQVDNIEISRGDYDEGQLERFLNTQARNWLTVALIGGVDKVPGNIRLTEKQLEELEQIHQKIEGKRTAIFCLSIAHAETLAEILRGFGIKAEAIHGQTTNQLRQKHLTDHKEDITQVLLGVDILTRGWDSPETEVGIYLTPTRSGIVGVQQLGRILRPSQDTGKERAIAIQFVDKFNQKKQAPVLIPNIFDPYYILRGTQSGRDIHRIAQPLRQQALAITFSGMGIETLIHEAQSQDLLQHRLKGASLEEISQTLESVLLEIQQEQPDAKPLQIYQALAEKLPYHIPFAKQQEALQAAANLDSNISKIGRNLLVLLHIRSILGVVESYFSDNQEDNNDIIQAAIDGVVFGLSRLSPNIPITQQIYGLAERGTAQFISKKKNMPIDWVLEQKEEEAVNLIQEELANYPDVLDKKVLESLSLKLHEKTGLSRMTLKQYIRYLWDRKPEIRQEKMEDSVYAETVRNLLKEVVKESLVSLTARERKVLRLRFALAAGGKDRPLTLEEVSEEFGLTGRERIHQIEAKALRKLRHPSRSKHLKGFLEIDEPIIPIKYTQPNKFGQIIPPSLSQEEYYEEYYRKGVIKKFSNLSRLGLNHSILQCLKSYGIFEIGDFFSATPEEIFQVEAVDLSTMIDAVKKLSDDDELKRLSEGSLKDEDLLLTYLTDAIIYRDQEQEEALKMLATYSINARRELFVSAYHQLKSYLERLIT